MRSGDQVGGWGTVSLDGLAYQKDLFAIPVVVTINYSTRSLAFLQNHDWLGKPANRVIIFFPLESEAET